MHLGEGGLDVTDADLLGDEGTEVERSLVAADAGTAVPPDDLDAFCAALEPLLDDAARREAMG